MRGALKFLDNLERMRRRLWHKVILVGSLLGLIVGFFALSQDQSWGVGIAALGGMGVFLSAFYLLAGRKKP